MGAMTDTTASHHHPTAAVAPATRTSASRTPARCANRLRRVLRANAVNSFAAGLLLAFAPTRFDELLDTGHPGWIRVVGVALLPFAGLCAWLSSAPIGALRGLTPLIVAGDVTWVVASVVTVLLGWYSGGGAVAVLAMAAVVDLFALLQWSAWRTLQPTR